LLRDTVTRIFLESGEKAGLPGTIWYVFQISVTFCPSLSHTYTDSFSLNAINFPSGE